ncbi:MAG: AI-2E family transporter [Thermodesulfobacteriota bacterium]|nr:AI-2E family transporter [Thermodesulfobacteriota bacterium]
MTNDKPAFTERFNMAHYFLLFLLIVSLFFCYRIIRPYFDPIFFALMLAALASPIYQWIEKKTRGRKNLAALIACGLLTVVIIVPFIFLLLVIINQGINSFNAISAWIAAGNLERLQDAPFIAKMVELGRQYIPDRLLADMDLKSAAVQASSAAGKALVSQGGQIIGNISVIVIKFLLMIFVFFFVLKDQDTFYEYVRHLSPLSSKHEAILLQKIKDVAKSALLGSLVTAAAQGAAGGIAFSICGLPGFFWGAMMAFSSLVPVVGTALIWVPAAGYLFISGAWGFGIFMVIWSVMVVGMIDNFLRPLFMKGGAGMSTVIIFFAILGGINYFGLSGLIYGPLIVGITMVLLYIYDLEFNAFLNSQDRTE